MFSIGPPKGESRRPMEMVAGRTQPLPDTGRSAEGRKAADRRGKKKAAFRWESGPLGNEVANDQKWKAIVPR